MVFESVLYDKLEGNVAKITMNRPEYRNAESRMMSRELLEAFKVADEDPEVRVIILAGAGSSFSSGHDLGTPQERASKETDPDPHLGHGTVQAFVHEKARWVDAWLYVRDLGKPTIAQVHGHAIMGGFMLAAMCDLIIASDDAKFADMGVRMGGAGVETFFHPWQLGIRKCKEFMFTGDYMDAQEAWRVGFVNRVVPREKLEEETLSLARRIALVSPVSLRFAKLTINDAEDMMGFRNSVASHFKVHHLVHAYTDLEADNAMRKLRREGGDVRGFLMARDQRFAQKG